MNVIDQEMDNYKGLRFRLVDVATNQRNPFGLKYGYGRARAEKYYVFPTAERREDFLANLKREQDRKEKHRAERKQRDEEARLAMINKIDVGTILYDSWGYDQTNVDFYQVTEKKGSTVTLRSIQAEQIEGSESFMSDMCRPVKDAFIGPEIPRKRISAYGVKVDQNNWARPIDDKVSFFRSWYA